MVAAGSKCRTCKAPAIIDLPRHNANFCAEHFLELCRRQVAKAIEHWTMFEPRRPRPGRRVRRQGQPGGVGPAARARLPGRRAVHRPRHRRLQRDVGRVRPRLRRRARPAADRGRRCATSTATTSRPRRAATRRVPCSSCGLSKRHLFDKAALDGGYDVVVTGHNLDDEAAVLFGNTLRWDDRVPRPPAAGAAGARRLPAEGQAARPADRAGDRGVVRGPRHRLHRRGVPDGRGQQAPRLQGRAQRDRARRRRAAKAAFYLNFVERMAPLLAGRARRHGAEVGACRECGSPTSGEVCAFCRLVDTASAHEPVPVELVVGRRGRAGR